LDLREFRVEWAKFGDLRVPVEPAVMSEKMLRVIREGRYESAEAKHLPAILKKGDRLVELGGGVGFLSSLAGRTGLVDQIAVYEANPPFVSLIRQAHRANSVTAQAIWGAVVAEKTSPTIPFYVRSDFWASSLSPGAGNYREVIDVPCYSLTEILAANKPTILVSDVEGGEGALFRNIDLAGITRVYIEIHRWVLGDRGVRRLFDFFSKQEFVYDPRYSSHAVILFRRIGSDKPPPKPEQAQR
jgi:FkbM family methyltransferase